MVNLVLNQGEMKTLIVHKTKLTTKINKTKNSILFGSQLSAIHSSHLVPPHLGEVDREVECADDSVVAVGDGVLDVVRRRVDEHTALVPRTGLHPGKWHTKRYKLLTFYNL